MGRGVPSLVPPTLADVAEVAGVSRQTVSNALNNPDLLRPDTLARVLQAIAELGYTPNRAARNLRTRASHLIGMRFTPRASVRSTTRRSPWASCRTIASRLRSASPWNRAAPRRSAGSALAVVIAIGR